MFLNRRGGLAVGLLLEVLLRQVMRRGKGGKRRHRRGRDGARDGGLTLVPTDSPKVPKVGLVSHRGVPGRREKEKGGAREA